MHASYQVAPRTAWTKRLRPPHDWLTGRDVGSGGGEIGCEKLAAQRIGFKKMTLVIAIVSAIRFFRVPSYPAVISGAGRKSHSSVHHTELRYGSYRVTKCQINDRRSKHRQMAVLAIPVSLGGPLPVLGVRPLQFASIPFDAFPLVRHMHVLRSIPSL
jgi:hypothetical protein